MHFHIVPFVNINFPFYTGLTDEMRNDFSLMKDLAVHTRIDPKTRNQSLLKFMGQICRFVCHTGNSYFHHKQSSYMCNYGFINFITRGKAGGK